MENVVEGCVLETFGAAIATLQGERAEHAADAFRSIAVDERAHAVLSRDVHAWLSKQLTKRERAALDGARADAIASLPHASSSAEGRRLLGLPSADESRALAAVLF